MIIKDELKARLQQALIERCDDPDADLRARIAASLMLGELGDPRFERREGPYGEYLLPPLVDIPKGTYTLGSDKGEEHEKPVHTVELEAFQIGQFAVTNAEWRCFVEAGGYDDEQWWETEAAKAWQRGGTTAEGPKQQWRQNRSFIQDNIDKIRLWPQQGPRNNGAG